MTRNKSTIPSETEVKEEILFIKKVIGIMEALGINNVTEEEIANSLEGKYVEQVNRVAKSQITHTELQEGDKTKAETTNSKDSHQLTPDEFRELQNKILLYKNLDEQLSTQIKELENVISNLKASGNLKKTSTQIEQLQKLKNSLDLTRTKLAAYTKLDKEYQKQRELEMQVLRKRAMIAKLMKDKKKKEAALQRAIESSKGIDVLANFLLPGKWLKEYKETQQAQIRQTAQALTSTYKKIDAAASALSKAEGSSTKNSIEVSNNKAPTKQRSLQPQQEQIRQTQKEHPLQVKVPVALFAKTEVRGAQAIMKVPVATPGSAQKQIQEKKNKDFQEQTEFYRKKTNSPSSG